MRNANAIGAATMIDAAAAIIRHYSADAAAAFIHRPFSRVDIAYAFAAGFATADTDDIHPHASAVIRAAYADRDSRRGT